MRKTESINNFKINFSSAGTVYLLHKVAPGKPVCMYVSCHGAVTREWRHQIETGELSLTVTEGVTTNQQRPFFLGIVNAFIFKQSRNKRFPLNVYQFGSI